MLFQPKLEYQCVIFTFGCARLLCPCSASEEICLASIKVSILLFKVLTLALHKRAQCPGKVRELMLSCGSCLAKEQQCEALETRKRRREDKKKRSTTVQAAHSHIRNPLTKVSI